MQLDLAKSRKNRGADARRARRPLPIQRLQRLVGLRFDPSGDLDDAPDQRRARRAFRSGPSTSARSIGFSSRGGPGSSRTTASPFIEPQPGCAAALVLDDRAPAGTIACRRLISGIGIV